MSPLRFGLKTGHERSLIRIFGFLFIIESALAALTLASETAFILGAPIPSENAPKMIPKKHEMISPGASMVPALFFHQL